MNKWKDEGFTMNTPTSKTADVKIDHFTDGSGETYEMRYLYSDKFYNETYGPILFYAGNEGKIPVFWDNSGFVTDTLAEELGALVIFAEHRYYGESMPFGNSSYDKENLKYFTVPQAMLDYVDLLNIIKEDKPELKDRATILFGGSYGGMLASWMRMKYPQHFQGALASSAPILYFNGTTLPYAYSDFASKVYLDAGGK